MQKIILQYKQFKTIQLIAGYLEQEWTESRKKGEYL